jgi:hypothetical protein
MRLQNQVPARNKKIWLNTTTGPINPLKRSQAVAQLHIIIKQ